MKPLFSAHGLGHHFDSNVVFAGLDLAVEPGTRLAILGASGSGKTTLLRLIAGLLRPTEGEIFRSPELTMGLVFQDLALWPNLTALQNVSFVLQAMARAQRNTAAVEALEQCRIGELANRLPRELSVGQQQRLALARAVAARPKLLILDEPFSSLDLVLKSELFDVVREVSKNATLILVTHDPLEALALCHSGLVLESGKPVEIGPLKQILENPTSRLLRAFADAIRKDPPTLDRGRA